MFIFLDILKYVQKLFQKPIAYAPGCKRLVHLEVIRMERAEAEDMKMVCH
jgi:hypothetical protein